MELEPNGDQQMLVDTTRRFLDDRCPITAVRALGEDPLGYDPAVWSTAADLGFTSMLVPAADGGGALSEHGILDLVLVAEEMGRRVAPGPLVAVNVVADAIGRIGSSDQRARVLPGLIAGELIATWCGARPIAARPDGDELVLSGTCAPVEAATGAQELLVTVDEDPGTSLVLVPAGADGVRITAMAGIDLVRRFAQVRFDSVRVPVSAVVGHRGEATAEVGRALGVACVLQCAEMAGVMAATFEMTLEYLGDRWSFGRPLASYQALKHRIADHKTTLESVHATVSAAARAVATDAPDAPVEVSAAKMWVGPQVTEAIQDFIQLHGGIGVTWEHDLHLYLRRATTDRMTHGTSDEHAERIAGRLLDTTGTATAIGVPA